MTGRTQRVSRLEQLWIACYLIVALVSCPVWLPFALLYCVWETLRVRRIANRSSCPSCGNILGAASIRLAREHGRVSRAERSRRFKGRVSFRRDPRPYAMCVTCGAWSYLDAPTKLFVLKESAPRGSKRGSTQSA